MKKPWDLTPSIFMKAWIKHEWRFKSAGVLICIAFLNLWAEARSVGEAQWSFNKSKKSMLKLVYFDHRKTFYCDKAFTMDLKVDGGRDLSSARLSKRSQRVEWEHVVPAHAFGQAFAEWREGHPECTSKNKPFKGRNCARKKNLEFRKMEADMYNLVPAIGEVNQRRAHHSFAELGSAPQIFPGCAMKKLENKVEPPQHRKGDVARIYLYMDSTYPGRGVISEKNRPLFEAWNKQDPVDPWECTRYQRIKAVQKTENPLMQKLCP